MDTVTFLRKRALHMAPVLFGIVLAVFLMVRLIPGDPARIMLGTHATPERIAELQTELGLDQPLWRQFLLFIGNVVQGELGTSLVFRRTVDTFTAFPFLIMVIGIIAILGPGLTSMYIALTLAGWSAYARIIRGEILVIKKSEYVLAARSLSYHNARIIFRHVLPNVITPAIIFAMTDIVLVILSTTSLSFLGLGVQPPTPEWGSMIAEGRSYIMLAWWMVTLPGLAIVLVGFALSLFGDGVADLLRNED